MLTALTADNQELFLLIDCSIDELTQIRSEQAFVCPMCHQSVILKAGPIKIPHFAHRKRIVVGTKQKLKQKNTSA